MVCNSTFVPAFVRRLHSRNGIRSQGWTSAVERLRPGRKRSPSGAFGGWNDLDRLVQWKEGGGESKGERCAVAPGPELPKAHHCMLAADQGQQQRVCIGVHHAPVVVRRPSSNGVSQSMDCRLRAHTGWWTAAYPWTKRSASTPSTMSASTAASALKKCSSDKREPTAAALSRQHQLRRARGRHRAPAARLLWAGPRAD